MKRSTHVLIGMVFLGLVFGLTGCGPSVENQKAQFSDITQVTDALMQMRIQNSADHLDWNRIEQIWFGQAKAKWPTNQTYWAQQQQFLENHFQNIQKIRYSQLTYLRLLDQEPNYYPIPSHGPEAEVVYTVYGNKRMAREVYYLVYDKDQQRYVFQRADLRVFSKPTLYDRFTHLRLSLANPATQAPAEGPEKAGTGTGHQ